MQEATSTEEQQRPIGVADTERVKSREQPAPPSQSVQIVSPSNGPLPVKMDAIPIEISEKYTQENQVTQQLSKDPSDRNVSPDFYQQQQLHKEALEYHKEEERILDLVKKRQKDAIVNGKIVKKVRIATNGKFEEDIQSYLVNYTTKNSYKKQI